MNKSTDCFYIDFEKFDALCKYIKFRSKTKKISDRELSRQAGYAPPWLCGVRNRSTPIRISLTAAQRMAEYLECGIQDFRDEKATREKTPRFCPVLFEAETEARTRFSRLITRESVGLAEILRFAEENIIGMYYLRMATRPKMQAPSDYVGNEWVKMLCVSAYARLLVRELKCNANEKYLRDRFEIKWKQAGGMEATEGRGRVTEDEGKRRKVLEGIIGDIFTKELKRVDVADFEDELKETIADFLLESYKYHENEAGFDIQIRLYKNGELF